jgi:Predicted membrane protein
MLTLKSLKTHPVFLMIVATTIVLFASSSARHALFHSTAYDLAIFDQAVYLISQNQTPFSSLMAVNILGDHTAFIFYPLALLYKIYPDVHWLLFVQAISLALGAWPSWSLARQAGLNERKSMAVAAVYLLYPAVFNVNLFDFHPEVIAVPAFLAAIVAARLDKILWFCAAIVLILSCKAVLSLTVAAMGLWLLIFDKKRNCGLLALFFGVAWFLIATQAIIPYFNQGKEHAGIGRYQYLGKSVLEIAVNLILKPNLVLGRLFSLETFEYLALLLFPVIWWISPRHLTPLISAVPMLAMNILSDIPAQRDLIHQYSIPIFPFLLVAVIANLSDSNQQIFKLPKILEKLRISSFSLDRNIVIWALIAFLCLAKYGYFWTIYLEALDTLPATKEAISLVQTKGNVLTTANIAPHLAHRPVVKLTQAHTPPANLTEFDYVLLNWRYPGWMSDRAFVQNLVTQLTNNPQFQLKYQRDDIYLFTKK